MATQSSTLAWKIPWTEEPVGYGPWGYKESDTTEQYTYMCIYILGEQDFFNEQKAIKRKTKFLQKPQCCQILFMTLLKNR